MNEERKQPGVGFWCTVALLSPLVLYPLSFGPAYELVCRGFLPRTATYRFYRPLLHNAVEGRWPMRQYARLWGIHRVYLIIQDIALDYEDAILVELPSTPVATSDAAPESD